MQSSVFQQSYPETLFGQYINLVAYSWLGAGERQGDFKLEPRTLVATLHGVGLRGHNHLCVCIMKFLRNTFHRHEVEIVKTDP